RLGRTRSQTTYLSGAYIGQVILGAFVPTGFWNVSVDGIVRLKFAGTESSWEKSKLVCPLIPRCMAPSQSPLSAQV
ncbi:hypothetical protein, partial [Bradyrhizobium sp. IC3123]|uniref:hypothetical protein n=1 Tax=Bradyrhizobium sp. IC3123 TaxID=2793803 RepID=UPI001CD7264F